MLGQSFLECRYKARVWHSDGDVAYGTGLAEFRQLHCEFLACLDSRGSHMDLILVDWNFHVLPEGGSERSVSIKTFGKRVRSSDKDLDVRPDSG